VTKTLFDDVSPQSEKPTITALAPWFGSNRTLAAEVGKELTGCRWVGVPFAGGMTELLYIDAPTIVVGDLHHHVINLARVAAHPTLGPQLYRRLRRRVFHELEHSLSQDLASLVEIVEPAKPIDYPCIDSAEQYFVAVWMGRSAKAGIDDEFNGGLPVRWNANGGDSCKRYRSAVSSLPAWRRTMQRCTFLVKNAFEFLAEIQDVDRHGIYCDPPFIDAGKRYKYNCGKTAADQEAWHRTLAGAVSRFEKARVVCRFYDHPLIRELYPETRWTWRLLKGRDQANNGAKPEVLLVNRSSGGKA
jgi:hypothetical protein